MARDCREGLLHQQSLLPSDPRRASEPLSDPGRASEPPSDSERASESPAVGPILPKWTRALYQPLGGFRSPGVRKYVAGQDKRGK